MSFTAADDEGTYRPHRALSSPCGRPCGKLDGYGEWWFWRHTHQQLGSYLGRTRTELA
jgi:hypothetical protein